MDALTELERAALLSIFSETPDLAVTLERRMAAATVTGRENTGVGFFTTVAVPATAAQASCPSVLGHETHARVHGLDYGLGFVLFVREGRLNLLEGHTHGPEGTASLDLASLASEVFRAPTFRSG